jgi:hypothetical protein
MWPWVQETAKPLRNFLVMLATHPERDVKKHGANDD